MSYVHLPYTLTDAPSFRAMNAARRLVSEELHRSRGTEIEAAQRQFIEQQESLGAEWGCFQESMAAACDPVTADGVILSPLSGRCRLGAGRAEGDAGEKAIAATRCRLFPPVDMPSSDGTSGPSPVAQASRKRTRHEAEADEAENGEGDAPATRIRGEPNSDDALLFRNASTPPSMSANGVDAVYAERLLGQSIGAKLFLAHANLLQHGEAFLWSLQQTQQRLLASEIQVDTINALRQCEQEEFMKTYTDLLVQASKTRKKVVALEKALGLSAEVDGKRVANGTRVSLLSRLAA